MKTKKIFTVIFLFLMISMITAACNSKPAADKTVPAKTTPAETATEETTVEQGSPEWIFVASSGGFDGQGEQDTGYDGITINADEIIYYKDGKVIDRKPISYITGKSIIDGEDKELLKIGESDVLYEISIDENRMILYENVYDGYQYEFEKSDSR